jgi:hypothetical protein
VRAYIDEVRLEAEAQIAQQRPLKQVRQARHILHALPADGVHRAHLLHRQLGRALAQGHTRASGKGLTPTDR